MNRREALSKISGSIVGATALTATSLGQVSGASISLTKLRSDSDGYSTTHPGSLRIDVVGANFSDDSEVEEAYTTLRGTLSYLENNDAIKGYEVNGWNSDAEFSSTACNSGDYDACACLEEGVDNLEGTSLMDESNGVAWLWYCRASFSYGHEYGTVWEDPSDKPFPHQSWIDNKNPRDLGMATAHEVLHSMIKGGSNSYPEQCNVDAQAESYEACPDVADLSNGNDHNLGTVKRRYFNGSIYAREETPLGYNGTYDNDPCGYTGEDPDGFTSETSTCTADAVKDTWHHEAGYHSH